MSFKQIYNNKEYDLAAYLSETEKSELRLKTLALYGESKYETTIGGSSSELYKSERAGTSYAKYFTRPVYTYVYANGHLEIDWGNIENTIIDFKKEVDTQNSRKTISLFADKISCPECVLYSGGSVDPSGSGTSQSPKWVSYINADDSSKFTIKLFQSGNNIALEKEVEDSYGKIIKSTEYLNTLALIINIQGPGADGGYGHYQGMTPARAKGGGGGGAGAFLSLFVNFSTSEFSELYIDKMGRAVNISTSSGMNVSKYKITLSEPEKGEGSTNQEDNNNIIANGGNGGKISIEKQNTFFRPLLKVDGGNGGAGGLSTSTGSVSDSDGGKGETVEGDYHLFPSYDSSKFKTIKGIGGDSGESSTSGLMRFAYGGGGGASLASRGASGGTSKDGSTDSSDLNGKSASTNNFGAGGGGGGAYSNGITGGKLGDGGKGGRGFVAIYF